MKKLIAMFMLLFGLSIPASAKTTPVEIMQDFSINNPSQTLLVKVLSNIRLNKDVMLHEGFYVLGEITGSGNGFVYKPIKFQNFHNEVFEIKGDYPATFVEVIAPAGTNGNLSKNAKILLDFHIAEPTVDNSIHEKYQDAPKEGISSVVNQQNLVIYDNTIPKTMQDFPGIKLNSFDNGSNFNIPKKLMIDYEQMEVNVNDLKENK